MKKNNFNNFFWNKNCLFKLEMSDEKIDTFFKEKNINFDLETIKVKCFEKLDAHNRKSKISIE